MSLGVNASISRHQTEQIFHRLVKANNINAQIGFSNSEEINAYGGDGQVIVTAGMLNYADSDIMISVLSHELGHVIGYQSEMGADLISGRIAHAAGYNICPGAYKILMRGPGKEGGGTHPDGNIRYNHMCRKN